MQDDEKYMRRAIQLACLGREGVWSNPMVGAVIVAPDGRIIGEGWHRQWGQGHAEVNAVASVADADVALLPHSTIYVTLEPCAHWGKTPPCARMLVERGLRRVVIGHRDPFASVDGRGIAMLQQAGIEVTEGILEDECRAINPHFLTAHTLKRPFVTLKWAQTPQGVIDHRRDASHPGPLMLSSPLTSRLVHDLRRCHQGILVGSGTWLMDRPSLTVRGLETPWQPIRVILDRRGRLNPAQLLTMPPGGEIWHVTSHYYEPVNGIKPILVASDATIDDILTALYNHGLISLLVEGGAQVLQAFLTAGVYDAVHIETSPVNVATPSAATMPPFSAAPSSTITVDGRTIATYNNP